MLRTWLILGCLLAVVVQVDAATQVEGLYQVRVPVADQSGAERNRALNEALREAAVRVAGSRGAAQAEGLPSSPEDVDRVVQQYGYLSDGDGLQLRVRFDAAAVEQLLRQKGLPVWGSERPTTLVWLALQDGTQRRLLAADDAGPAGEALRSTAEARGVPVILPLMDLEDQSRVRFGDVWGGFFDSVLSASARYDADAVLIGRLQRQSGGWVGRWALYNRNQNRQWSVTTDSLAATSAAGIEQLADDLAARYAERPGTDAAMDHVRIRVDDVRSLDDYASLSQFLRSRELVSATRLLAVSGDQAYFELAVRGSPERLQRALSLWGRLALAEPPPQPTTTTAADAANNPTGGELHFRLVP